MMTKYIEKRIEFFTSEHLREIIKYYELKYHVIGYRAWDQENKAILYLVPKLEIKKEKKYEVERVIRLF